MSKPAQSSDPTVQSSSIALQLDFSQLPNTLNPNTPFTLSDLSEVDRTSLVLALLHGSITTDLRHLHTPPRRGVVAPVVT